MTSKEKFVNFYHKSHLFYLIIAILLYLFKGIMYFIIAKIPTTVHIINMDIDKNIPFIKYFYIFYFPYYFLPELLLWALSFFNLKKFWTLYGGAICSTLVCFVFFIVFQVKMIRQPGYPMNIGLGDIHSVSDLFDYFISFQYRADADALNCFPSLHATMGCLEVLLGLKLSKKEKSFPLWIRLIAIIMGIGCILSTVFIKQHYFVDMVAGVILMVIMYIVTSLVINRMIKKCKLQSLIK